MFRIECLPAQQGDAIWIEYGTEAIHRVLIDAGTPATGAVLRQRIARLPVKQRRFDLLVITHVDTDHIGGLLKLLNDLPEGVSFDDIWFNGWQQIRPRSSSQLGPIDGEILSEVLRRRRWPWNNMFAGTAVMSPIATTPIERFLRGGMTLTILAPGEEQLARLADEWKKVVREAGLDPKDDERPANMLRAATRRGVKNSILGDRTIDALANAKFTPDTAVANGSTIALLAEFDKKRVVLAGDAHASVLVQALTRVRQARRLASLDVDVFKVSHHGSQHNVSSELLTALSASRYIFSTNGAMSGHPDDETVARVITTPTRRKRTLVFNYTAATIVRNAKEPRSWPDWNGQRLKDEYKYDLEFPPSDDEGIAINL